MLASNQKGINSVLPKFRKDLVLKQKFCIPWRTVKVFISSTFRDMHAERDHLIKVVFPSIKTKLEKFNIDLIDIDLRWGITKEQADNDHVLDLCLQLIDESRPFFVSLLGERYGWIPKSYPNKSLSQYGWLQHLTDKSITELEILHGVLNNTQMMRYAFFYLRDPESLSEIPAEIKNEIYIETDDYLKRKLNNLKERIIKSGYPVFENYPAGWDGNHYDKLTKTKGRLSNLEEFGEMVKNQLLESLKVEFNLPEKIDDEKEVTNFLNRPYLDGSGNTIPLKNTDYKSLDKSLKKTISNAIQDYRDGNLKKSKVTTEIDIEQEMKGMRVEIEYHDRAIQKYRRTYIHRNELESQIIQYAENEDNRVLALIGEDGIGKSSLLAWFYEDYTRYNENLLIIPHFVGASPFSTDLKSLILRISLTLKSLYKIDISISKYSNRIESISNIFRTLLTKIPESEKVIILIDDFHLLNLTKEPDLLNWVPPYLPANVKIIISTSVDDQLQKKSNFSISEPDYAVLKIPYLNHEEKEGIIDLIPSISAKSLDRDQKALLLSNQATDIPLFLITAIEELHNFGSFKELNHRIKNFPRPEVNNMTVKTPIIELIKQVIERLEDDFDHDVVRNVLSSIAICKDGIFLDELEKVISGQVYHNDLHAVLRQIRLYLYKSGALIKFAYSAFYDGVINRYLYDDKFGRNLHEKIARIIELDINKTKSVDYLITKGREAVAEFGKQLGLNQDNPFFMYDLDRFTQYKRDHNTYLFHLAKAKLWDEVFKNLTNLEVFVRLWSTDDLAVMNIWQQVETESSYSAKTAYENIVQNPEKYKYYVHPVGLLMFFLKHTDEARVLFSWLMKEIIKKNDLDLVQEEIPGDFYVLMKQFDRALMIYTMEEKMAIALGDEFSAQLFINRQADVYLKCGKPHRALSILLKQIEIDSVTTSFYDRILLLEKTVEITESLDLTDQTLTQLVLIEDLARKYRLKDKLQSCLGKQAQLYIKKENYEKAMVLLREQEELCRN